MYLIKVLVKIRTNVPILDAAKPALNRVICLNGASGPRVSPTHVTATSIAWLKVKQFIS